MVEYLNVKSISDRILAITFRQNLGSGEHIRYTLIIEIIKSNLIPLLFIPTEYRSYNSKGRLLSSYFRQLNIKNREIISIITRSGIERKYSLVSYRKNGLFSIDTLYALNEESKQYNVRILKSVVLSDGEYVFDGSSWFYKNDNKYVLLLRD